MAASLPNFPAYIEPVWDEQGFLYNVNDQKKLELAFPEPIIRQVSRYLVLTLQGDLYYSNGLSNFRIPIEKKILRFVSDEHYHRDYGTFPYRDVLTFLVQKDIIDEKRLEEVRAEIFSDTDEDDEIDLSVCVKSSLVEDFDGQIWHLSYYHINGLPKIGFAELQKVDIGLDLTRTISLNSQSFSEQDNDLYLGCDFDDRLLSIEFRTAEPSLTGDDEMIIRRNDFILPGVTINYDGQIFLDGNGTLYHRPPHRDAGAGWTWFGRKIEEFPSKIFEIHEVPETIFCINTMTGIKKLYWKLFPMPGFQLVLDMNNILRIYNMSTKAVIFYLENVEDFTESWSIHLTMLDGSLHALNSDHYLRFTLSKIPGDGPFYFKHPIKPTRKGAR